MHDDLPPDSMISTFSRMMLQLTYLTHLDEYDSPGVPSNINYDSCSCGIRLPLTSLVFYHNIGLLIYRQLEIYSTGIMIKQWTI
jgi:hypothetical protein